MPTTVPVKDASGNTFNMVVNPAYDAQDDMIKMKSVQKKWRDSFTTGTLEPSKWTSIVGAGASISVTGGTLVMASGTTIAAETSVLSVETFTIPFRVQVGLTLSARILNQTFLRGSVRPSPRSRRPLVLASTNWSRSPTRLGSTRQYSTEPLDGQTRTDATSRFPIRTRSTRSGSAG
jgi:hypothetical protein